ncbi:MULTISPECIES: hypothetical protein [Streptomyces]|uniref:hypothetical protein n=1 Tax=Streptomyces TaxID=1883 RepID=UPI00203D9C42|nr:MULTISPECIES: hypothetical protein [unclassified Streptomyces]
MSATSAPLLDDVRSLVVPATDALGELAAQAGEGKPSWRARFVRAAIHDPQAAKILRGRGDEAPAAARIVHAVVAGLDHLPAHIVRGRAALMTHIITPACAEHEEQAARDTTTARWQATGDFLSAAITGMLQAPVTQTRQPPR